MQNVGLVLEVLVGTDIAPRHGESALHAFELNLRDGSDDTKAREGNAIFIANGFKAKKRDVEIDSHREDGAHIDVPDVLKSKKRDSEETESAHDGDDIVVADGF